MGRGKSSKTAEILRNAVKICEEFQAQGFDLTLRQLYYQFVSRGLHGSGDSHYRRLGRILTEARIEGTFPLHFIVDRGRNVGVTGFAHDATDPEVALRQAADELRRAPYWIWRDRWFGQPVVPFVWIEKDALAGIYERTCSDLKVGLFPCKGYPSISALAEFCKSVEEAIALGADDIVILYAGDHDPDGLEIPRSSYRNIEEMWENGVVLPSVVDFRSTIRLERVALSIEQIREHNAPPFAAKTTSTRFRSYFEETGLRDAWELDALPPTSVDRLLRDAVDVYFDEDIAADNDRAVREARSVVRKGIRDPAWIEGVFE